MGGLVCLPPSCTHRNGGLKLLDLGALLGEPGPCGFHVNDVLWLELGPGDRLNHVRFDEAFECLDRNDVPRGLEAYAFDRIAQELLGESAHMPFLRLLVLVWVWVWVWVDF